MNGVQRKNEVLNGSSLLEEQLASRLARKDRAGITGHVLLQLLFSVILQGKRGVGSDVWKHRYQYTF